MERIEKGRVQMKEPEQSGHKARTELDRMQEIADLEG